MEQAGVAAADHARALIDELAAAQHALAAAQARQALLMLEFEATRERSDRHRIADKNAAGLDARYQAGEFAAMEIGLAITASKHRVQRTLGIAHRLRTEAPEAWDAWQAGDIDQLKAAKINHALLRLTRTASKDLLNALVVPVAACKTAELLGRWLNAFIARYEPDETDDRLHRALEDRYVTLRPDLDGISFLSAAVSSLDAAGIDQILNALAAQAGPDDARTLQQRRADALVDMLLGRASTGCHLTWHDADGHDIDNEFNDEDRGSKPHQSHHGADNSDPGDDGDGATSDDDGDDFTSVGDGDDSTSVDGGGVNPSAVPWDPDTDFDLPVSAFRPDHSNTENHSHTDDHVGAAAEPPGTKNRSTSTPSNPDRPGRAVITSCPGGHPGTVQPVTIGVVVSIQSLYGYTNTPGQLADRSALVPADTIRSLANRADTLFYRLLTDQHGNLLATTELGRFPSRKLGTAIKLRDGTCENPGCTVPAHRCDLDHLRPAPDGPTTATNLGCKCRSDHRAKTHADHHSTRAATHITRWTTPTGHTYDNHDDPFPVENWPESGEVA